MENGWRISLALAGLPALVLLAGGIFLPETPDSLAERGLTAKARANLILVRGTEDVGEELDEIMAAAEAANKVMLHQQCLWF